MGWQITTPSRFQFHKGSIKTTKGRKDTGMTKRFQFHKGSIKTKPLEYHIGNLAGFNSTKVRLRLPARPNRLPYSVRFNSTKVRLRLRSPLPFHAPQKFQFHKGSIKTSLKRRCSCLYYLVSIPQRFD